MKLEIQRWALIGVLAFNFLSRAPGLVRQGWMGVPALLIGAFVVFVLISLLWRASAGAALFLAVMAALGAMLRLCGFFLVEPRISASLRSSPFEVALSVALSVVAAFCAMNLWSAWRKKPNQPPEPTR